MTGKDSSRPPSPAPSLLWATPEHAAEIAALHGELFSRPWAEPEVSRLLEHPGSVALLARFASRPGIVGFALAQIAADEAEVLAIATARDWQHRGIGMALMAGLERAAARAGARRLYLEVAEGNTIARALYAKRGYRSVGRRTDYYARLAGGREDALALAVDLPAGVR